MGAGQLHETSERRDGADRRAEYVTLHRDDLSALVRAAVAEGIREGSKDHVCYLPQEHQAVVKHAIGLFRDLGDGDADRGVEVLREHSRTVRAFVRVRDRVGNVVVGVITTGVLAVIGAALLGYFGKGK